MKAGEKIDRFEIRERIHVGAVAEVYLVWDPLRQVEVVLKVLRSEHVFDESFMKSFRRELSVSMLLDHPCIVPIRDIRLDGDHPFFSMPYYAAGTLKDRIAQAKERGRFLSLEDAQRVMRCVGAGLDAAHTKEYDPDPERPGSAEKQHGILHRDVKPSNTFLEIDKDGSISRALVADFGIAHAMGSVSITRDTTGGTAPYFSPEVGTNRIEPRSDLYSHAVMMFEVLTNELPILPSDQNSLVAWLRHHAEAPPRNARALRPELPDTVDEFFAKALAKTPEDRFSSGAAMSDAFELAMRGRSALRERGVTPTKPAPGPAPSPFQNSPVSKGMTPPKSKAPIAAFSGLVAAVVLVGGFFAIKASSGGKSSAKDGLGGAEMATIDLSLRIHAGDKFHVQSKYTVTKNDSVAAAVTLQGEYQVSSIAGSPPSEVCKWKTILHGSAIVVRETDRNPLPDDNGITTWPASSKDNGLWWITPPVTMNLAPVPTDQSNKSKDVFQWAKSLSWKIVRTGGGVAVLDFFGWSPNSPCPLTADYLGFFSQRRVSIPKDGWHIKTIQCNVDTTTGIPSEWIIEETHGSDITLTSDVTMSKQ